MRALLLDGSPRLVTDLPAPPRREGEALIAVRVAGVCDTDLGLVRGYMGYRGVLGHEFVGVVTDCDDRAWVGRRVVGDINAGCGACDDCRLRGGHHCATRTVLGIAGRDGAIAEALTLPTRGLVALPDAVSDDAAVFAEPLAAALHVTDELAEARGRTGANDPVVVLGDGKLGLLIALALLSVGERVTLVGHHAHKLAIAEAKGATVLLERDAEGLSRASVVVEATGTAGGLRRALALTAPRGTLVLKTTVPEPPTIDTAKIVVDEVRVVGSRCGDMARAVDALARGVIDPRPLIAARYPLDDAERALEHAGRKGVLKVLVDVR